MSDKNDDEANFAASVQLAEMQWERFGALDEENAAVLYARDVIADLQRQLDEHRTVTDAKCKWTYDQWDDAYNTSCGKYWQFNDGGPKENCVRYCHYCGGTVAQEAGDD